MKKIIIIALLFCSFAATAQKTTPGNYTYVAQKYEWDAGIFKGLGMPSGAGPAAFITGQVPRAGGMYYDSVGVDSGYYIYSGLAWRKIDNAAAVTPTLQEVLIAGRVLTNNYTISGAGMLGITNKFFVQNSDGFGNSTTLDMTDGTATSVRANAFGGGTHAISIGNTVVRLDWSSGANFNRVDLNRDSLLLNTTNANFFLNVKKLPNKSALLATDSIPLVDANGRFHKINVNDLGISGGSGGLSEVVAGYGLQNVDDSTLRVDTTAETGIANKEWTRDRLDSLAIALDPNLIVQPLGSTGTWVLAPRNDTLYGRRLVAGLWVVVDTLATGEIYVGIDSADTDLQDFIASYGGGGGSGWGLTGNSGTTAGTNFVGTTDAVDLVFKTNNVETFRFNQSTGNGIFANSIQFGDGSTSFAGLKFSNSGGGNLGFYRPASNAIGVLVGSTEYYRFNSSTGFVAGSGAYLALGASASSPDTKLFRDAANTLALRNAAAAQEFRVFNTDATDDEFVSMGFINNANVFTIETEETGSGTIRNMALMGGNIGLNTASPTARLDVNSDVLRLRTAKTPASATDTGNAGDICWDATYIYVCIATNTWRRIAHSTW